MPKTAVDEWSESNVWLDLPDDGCQAVVVFGEDGKMFSSQSRFGVRERAVFPVLTLEGLRLFGASKRTTRMIRGKWDQLKGKAVRVQRIGAAGSPATTYKFYREEGQLALEDAAQQIFPDEIEALLEAARTGGQLETPDDDEI